MESKPGSSFLFDAFSLREPAFISLENAMEAPIDPPASGGSKSYQRFRMMRIPARIKKHVEINHGDLLRIPSEASELHSSRRSQR